MNHLLKTILLSATIFACSATAFASEKASADEAVAFVKKAIAYFNANGKEKAFAEFSNPKGQFIHKDLYIIVVDSNINMVAHGANPRLIGKNLMDLKDAEGKPFGKMMTETGNGQGKGWVDYKWPNPITKSIDSKSTYLEKSGEFIFAAGIYK